MVHDAEKIPAADDLIGRKGFYAWGLKALIRTGGFGDEFMVVPVTGLMFGDDRIKQFDADIGKEGYKQAVKTNNECLYVCFFLERIDQHVALNLLSHPEALVFLKR
jgi:hypothetical protein